MTKLSDIFSLFSQRPADGTMPFCVGPEKKAQFFNGPETIITPDHAIPSDGEDIYSTDTVNIREYSFGYGCLREGFKILGWVDAANLQSFLKKARQSGNSDIYIQYIEDDHAEQHVTLKLEQMLDPFSLFESYKKEIASNDKPKRPRLKEKKHYIAKLQSPPRKVVKTLQKTEPIVIVTQKPSLLLPRTPSGAPNIFFGEPYGASFNSGFSAGSNGKTTPFEQHLKQITEKANRSNTCGPDGCHCDEPPCAPCPLDRFKSAGKSKDAWWKNFQAAIPMLGGLDIMRYYINEILTPEELSMIHFYCEEERPNATWQISYICNSTKNAGEIERNRNHRRLRGQL